jgi:predicted lipoprotein with Yx(FWY)xxD motif
MKTLLATAALLTLTACAAYAAPATVKDGMLVDANGMTLYTFDNDTPGVSNCMDGCVGKWPILDASAGGEAEEGWTIIDRADGAKQWAYDGQPLYLFAGDAAAGDTTGDGVGGVWHIARAE